MPGEGPQGPAFRPGVASNSRARNIHGMTDLQFAEDILARLQERNPRFHGKAYLFLLSSLHRVMEGLDEPRHISGTERHTGYKHESGRWSG